MRQNVNWQSDGGGEQSKSGVTAGEGKKKTQRVRQARDERERREREWVFVKASNKASQGRGRKKHEAGGRARETRLRAEGEQRRRKGTFLQPLERITYRIVGRHSGLFPLSLCLSLLGETVSHVHHHLLLHMQRRGKKVGAGVRGGGGGWSEFSKSP